MPHVLEPLPAEVQKEPLQLRQISCCFMVVVVVVVPRINPSEGQEGVRRYRIASFQKGANQKLHLWDQVFPLSHGHVGYIVGHKISLFLTFQICLVLYSTCGMQGVSEHDVKIGTACSQGHLQYK